MSTTANVAWRDFFFSPSGRFGRAQFWGSTLAVYGIVIMYFLPLAFIDTSKLDEHSIAEAAYIAIGVLLVVAGIVAHIFTIVKRFHDRDKPGLWWLIMFAPYIGGLWILIECGCMPGTEGPNAYDVGPAASDELPVAADHSF